MSHSEEFLRGAVAALERKPYDRLSVAYLLAQYKQLLAEAEARELAPDAAAVKGQIIAEYIDDNGITCDCCQHVMIDVTAAKTGVKGHCVAGDPEGEGSGCAWGWSETVEKRQLAIEQAAAVIAACREALDPFVRAYRISMEPFSHVVDEQGAAGCLPHGWPTVGDFKRAKIALAAIAAWEARHV